MSSRELISDDGVVRRYRVRDDNGEVIGADEEPVLAPAQINEQALRGRLLAGIRTNITYLRKPSPTEAVITAQVQELSRQVTAIERLLLELLDSTEGT